MKVSAFTFLRNAHQLGFPFVESIRSALPLVDEYIVNVGKSDDDTLEMVQAIGDPKIKIIETVWNEGVRTSGFIYGQQKMIAQYACTGDWAIYLEADEILHEKEHDNIRQAMTQYLNDDRVEALVLRYLNFYGNINTIAWSPRWVRFGPRIIKTAVRNYAPDGFFWVVFDKKNKKGRYPRAAVVDATVYHYGWVRPEQKLKEKFSQVGKYWKHWNENTEEMNVKYRAIDQQSLRMFEGTHPSYIAGVYPQADGVYQADPNHQLTKRERKNRIGMKLEQWFGWDLTNTHFKRVK